MNRYSLEGDISESNDDVDQDPPQTLSAIQVEKLTLFFTELLDTDRDDLIGEQDFRNFCEVILFFNTMRNSPGNSCLFFRTTKMTLNWAGENI